MAGAAWIRRSFGTRTEPSGEDVIAEPMSEEPGEWVLFVGENEAALEEAAAARLEGLVLSPPVSPPLPIAVHELRPPGLEGDRRLFVPRLDRAFVGKTSFAPTSPSYLIPAIAKIAAEGQTLHFVATAIGSELDARAKDVSSQRGAASRFQIRRVLSAPGERTESPNELDLSGIAPESGLGLLFSAGELLARGKRPEAFERLRRAVEVSPDLAPAYYELGKLQLQLDDMEGALASLRKTVALLPDYSSAWGNLGAALGEIQELDAALEALGHAVRLDPLSHALHSNRGVCLRDLGRLEESEASFRRALELDPGFVFGYYNLGHALYLQDRFDEAVEAFEKAQSLDSSRSPRQALLLAITRLATGDREGAEREYRAVFERLEETMRSDMRAVAEWDLKQLGKRSGVTPALRDAAGLLRALGGSPERGIDPRPGGAQ